MSIQDQQLAVADGPARVRLLSFGRVLILLEIYAVIAAIIALRADVYIAPLQLIFLALDDSLWFSIIVAAVCFAEFVWKRNALTVIALIVAITALGVAWSFTHQQPRHAPMSGTKRIE
ncbi:MAG TPA: hypothetical protein VHY33_02455 [Thermoanaerobaculia bacterium]|nr:hypothetical protein [Thermoanaerobaculia bacterium]